jgi:hypothetical protein
MSYYVVKVKVNHEDAKGRIKKLTEQYMVYAVSVTDAEAKIVSELITTEFGLGTEFEVSSVIETKIIKVIE